MHSTIIEIYEGEDLVLEGVKANGRVAGRMLDMHLEQRFRNPEPFNVEVLYTFPLPWQAVLLGLEVEFKDKKLVAQVKAKSTAREEYEEALSKGDTGILLTVNRDRTYKLELGNLMAGESCIIRLQYVQVLQPEQGSLRLMLPTTLAPKYGNPINDAGYDPHAVHEVSIDVEYPFDIRLTVLGELGKARISSPSHQVAIRALPSDGQVEAGVIEVSLGSKSWLDRDFVLLFNELPQASQGLVAWDSQEPGVGVVMAGFSPRLPVRSTMPLNLKLLVDCSGSMNGDSIQAARRALLGILAGLKGEDRFSLSRFGTLVDHRSRSMWKAATGALAVARRWAERLKADMGGTNMNEAIQSCLALPSAYPCDLLLITDGHIHAIDEVIESAKQSGHRFFVVGIGSSVSEGLLRRLAEETGGSCEFVAPGEQVESAILRLYRRLRSPAVLEARVQWPDGCELKAASRLPKNVFGDDVITVLAWVQAANPETLTQPIKLFGRLEGMHEEVLLAELAPALIADEPNTLARLAAYVSYRQLRESGDEASLVMNQELPALAEKYQLVTDDTSLVLVIDRAMTEKAQDMPALRKVRGMLAAGFGGEGCVPSVMREQTQIEVAPSMDSLSAQVQAHGVKPERLRQVESKAFRGVKATAGNKRLGSFIDSLFGTPENQRQRKEILFPEKTLDFWNDGDAYTADRSEWYQYSGLTPSGFVEWLRLNPEVRIGYVHFIKMNLPLFVQVWFEYLFGSGHSEELVIDCFTNIVLSQNLRLSKMDLTNQIGSKVALAREAKSLEQYMQHMVSGVTARCWPIDLMIFDEVWLPAVFRPAHD